MTATSSALNRGNSCSILRLPAGGQRDQDHATVARVLLPANEPATLERGHDARRGRTADAHGLRELARFHLPPHPEHPQAGEGGPRQPVRREDVRLHVPADRGGCAEEVRDGPHGAEVERTIAERFEHLPFRREQLVGHAAPSAAIRSPSSRATSRIASTSSSVVRKLTKHGRSHTPSVDQRRCQVHAPVRLDRLRERVVVGVEVGRRRPVHGGSGRSRAAAARPSSRSHRPRPRFGRAGRPRGGSARSPRGTAAPRAPGTRARASAHGTAASTRA